MHTDLADTYQHDAQAVEAAELIKACVHCGFCNATCPTYQLLGDERDGPRGRIYLIKQMLEGKAVTASTQLHLDRCLMCRACETTCPSGVRYGHLAELGRELVARQVERGPEVRFRRAVLHDGLLKGPWFGLAVGLGRLVRPVLPGRLKWRVPLAREAGSWPEPRHPRRVLLLDGCVQPILVPAINAAAARVLDLAGISAIRLPHACCGALSAHMGYADEAETRMQRNLQTWMTELQGPAEAMISTASGCSAYLKDYGWQLRNDPHHAGLAARLSLMSKDLVELIQQVWPSLRPLLKPPQTVRRVAVQAPCSLQHGQQLVGLVEQLLTDAGFELTQVVDGHLCCGSAGTYSLLQPELSDQLRANKLQALHAGQPQCIATANIGCMMHLQQVTSTPILHWIELIDMLIRET
ncbi:glycolate oxidase subunit GlcF [Chitinivorax sp. B]|uniref:glycolate oxidase subunit GlcF n=1 Tax=Chitinivorax sp. B TaxID=2502235 RepID=UPI0010F93459|nr:glycolate oxidase subunit GlcF [Chitinivorax sp. B]